MKVKYIFILFIISSCSQKIKEKNIPVDNVSKSIEKLAKPIEVELLKDEGIADFSDVIKSIREKTLPVIDNTNFDSFIDADDYDYVDVKALKLEEIYPRIIKEDNSCKAISVYKIVMSKEFYSIVFTVRKDYEEMETVLVNYDLEGNIIHSKLIAYDETAEGYSKIRAKIEQNKLTLNHIIWSGVEEIQSKYFEIDVFGKINPTTPINIYIKPDIDDIIESVIKQINIDKSHTSFIVSKVSPNNSNETIIVIPEVILEGEEDFELNNNIVIVDNGTGKITHKYFESSKSNGWVSDAIFIYDIAIDTTNYKLNTDEYAFGIITKFRTMSQPNPYYSDVISLFTKKNNSLKKIVDYLEIYESVGEVNVNACYSNIVQTAKILSIDDTMTNGYYDFLSKNTVTQINHVEDDKGDCNPIEKNISTTENVLRYNGSNYIE